MTEQLTTHIPQLKRQLLSAVAIAAGLALAACGGGSDDNNNTPRPPTNPPTNPPANPPGTPPTTGNAPVAVDDTATMAPGQPVTVNVLGNDRDADNNIDASTVRFTDPPRGATLSTDRRTLTVPGEGVWTVNAQGLVTFTPTTGFTRAPSEVEYTVSDTTGLTSDPADISITLASGTAISLALCSNPLLQEPGTVWTESHSSTLNGNIQRTSSVLDVTNYRGRPAARIRHQGNDRFNTISITYAGRDDSFEYQYGGEYTATDPATGFTSTGSHYYNPLLRHPLTLTPGQSFTDSYTTHNQSGVATVTNFTVTFEAMESITVPAGTFPTCRIRYTYPQSGVLVSWVVADGQYRGMAARQDDFNPDGSLRNRSVATAFSINR